MKFPKRLLPLRRGHRPTFGHPLRDGLDRRTVLRGLLKGSIVTVGLPPLLAFTEREARAAGCADGFPKRFAMFFWGNGKNY